MVEKDNFSGWLMWKSVANFVHIFCVSQYIYNKGFDIADAPNIFSFVLHFIGDRVRYWFEVRNMSYHRGLFSINIDVWFWYSSVIEFRSFNIFWYVILECVEKMLCFIGAWIETTNICIVVLNRIRPYNTSHFRFILLLTL